MSPNEFDFGPHYNVAIAANKLRRILKDAVATVGNDVASGACQCNPPDLSKALDGKDGRYVRIEWAFSIAAVVDIEQRRRIKAALVDWMGLSERPKTPEEQLEDLKHEIVKRFGPSGVDAIEEAGARR